MVFLRRGGKRRSGPTQLEEFGYPRDQGAALLPVDDHVLERVERRTLLQRIPEADHGEDVCLRERQQADLRDPGAEALLEILCDDEAERATLPDLAPEMLQPGNVRAGQDEVLHLGGDDQAIAFPRVDV